MPKGHKRKNAGVGVDFRKVKHKVGKKLPRAQNATDTTVRARAISLPEQSLGADKGGAAVTQRNLTLKDVLGQCGHYSERVRLDAINGLSELVRGHPVELRRSAAAVVGATAERMGDADAGCRAAALALLRSALLPALGPRALQPFAPLLMAHVCSAMTHLAESIRADALLFLAAMTEARPDLVAAGYLTQVLQHFADALARPARGRSLKAGSLGALVKLINGLHSFLARALPALQHVAGEDEPGGSGGGGSAGQTLLSQRCAWPPALRGGGGEAAVAAAAGREVARSLLTLLADCWAECGAGELGARPDAEGAQCATAILRCCDMLVAHWGLALAGDFWARGSLAATLLTRIAPHFPVHEPSVPHTAAAREQLVQLNLAAAQLLARFLPAALERTAPGTNPAARGKVERPSGGIDAAPTWVPRLLDWLEGVMAKGEALPELPGGGMRGDGEDQEEEHQQQQQQQQPQGEAGGKAAGSGHKKKSSKAAGSGGHNTAIGGEVYTAALEGVRHILPLLPPERRRRLLAAAWALWTRSAVRSGARARVLAFLGALLSDPGPTLYAPLPPAGEPLVLQEEAAQWVAAMPRFLWELGAGEGHGSGAFDGALRLLLDAARYAPPAGALPAALAALPPQMPPLFAVLLSGPGRIHLGPLASAPLPTQELAVDLLYHVPGLPEAVLKTTALVCLGGAYPVSTALRMLGVAASKAAAEEPAAFWALLLTLLAGVSSAGVEQQGASAASGPSNTAGSWARHEAVVSAAARAAFGYAGGAVEALEALGPPLLALRAAGPDGSDRPARPLYGCLQLCVLALEEGGSTLEEVGGTPQEDALPAELAAALPAAMLQLVQECACQIDPGADALRAEGAAALGARVLAAAPASLLAETLRHAAVQAQSAPEQAPAVAGLLVAAAREPRLAARWVQASDAAKHALSTLTASCGCGGSAAVAQPAVAQLAVLLSTLLGQDLASS